MENDESAGEDIEEVGGEPIGSDADAATTTASFHLGEKVINCDGLRGIIEHCYHNCKSLEALSRPSHERSIIS